MIPAQTLRWSGNNIDENGELIAHPADLFKHKFYGSAHPFDIHEYLPPGNINKPLGYELVSGLRQQAKVKVSPLYLDRYHCKEAIATCISCAKSKVALQSRIHGQATGGNIIKRDEIKR